MNEIKHLLSTVNVISKKYDDIAKITGENFNIFSIMKMENNEVYTHSSFIGELLNPKGSHGLEDIPLKLFIEQINQTQKKTVLELDTENSKSLIEKHIGITNEDKTEGGRIDILIKDNTGKAFVIENKIYAYEQENQLLRYNNAYPNAPILFLTLYGDEANSNGKLKLNEDYFTLSYREDILKWMENCLKEAVEFSMLREVIKQYIYLIKKLTNQTTNEKMKNEIIDSILKKSENIKSAFDIIEIGGGNLKLEICKVLFERIKQKVNSKTKAYNKEIIGNENSGLCFFKENSEIGVFLYFETTFDDLMIGVDFIENENNDDKLERRNNFRFIDEIVKGEKIKETNNTWIYSNYVNEFNDDSVLWHKILDGEIEQNISDKINQILGKLN